VAYTISFEGTRVNDSDTTSGWTKWKVGGGAPSAEPANRYQGSNVVGNQIKTAIGGLKYAHATGSNMATGGPYPLWFVKTVVTDYADLVTTIGASVSLGTSTGSRYRYIVAGSDANRSRFNAWPSQGGYLIFGLNPTVTGWREQTFGSPNLGSVSWFGYQVDTQTGLSKAENMGLDAIDVGTGLKLYGTTPTTGGYAAFVNWDQGVASNRYGVVVQPGGAGAPITCNGRLDIGTASAASDFTSANEVVVYPDGYHGEGDVGVLVNLTATGSTFSDSSTHIGLGSPTTEDTRPDYTFQGTGSPATAAFTLKNFNAVTLVSAVDANGVDIECKSLTQSGAEIQSSTIRTDATAGAATLQDPTFGETSGLHDTAFRQANAGHAIELTASSYAFYGLTFTNYGSMTANDAALYINRATGSVTIDINAGDSPTYRSTGASVQINNPKTHTISNLRPGDTVIWIGATATAGAEELENLVSATGGDLGYSYNYSSDITVWVQVLSGDNSKKNTVTEIVLKNENAGFPAVQADDLFYSNPT